jgi:arsenate reductase-like glutaredoxin family protein
MPTQEQAEKAWKHGNKGKKYYDAMTEEQKKAMWQYGYDRKLVDTSKLGPGALSEYQKYVNPNKPEYAMQASIVQAKPREYYQTQSEKVMSAITPSLVKNIASQTPEQIAAKKIVTQPAVLPVKRMGGKRLEDIEGDTPVKPVIRTNSLDRSQEQYSEGKEFKRSDAVLAGLASAATLGAPNKAIQQELKPGQQGYYIAGNIAGSIMPGAGLANAAGKGLAKLGAGKLVQNLGSGAIAGAAIDTTQGIVEGDTAGELAKRIGRGAAIGLIFDGALMGAGELFKRVAKNFNVPKELEQEIKREVGAFKIDSDGNVYKNGKFVRQLQKGGGGDVISAEGKSFIDPYGNVRTKPETPLQLSAPKQNLPVINETKTLTKTIGEPEKTILINRPFENTVNKVSTKKIKLTPEETQLDNVIKRSGTKIDELISEAEKTVKALEEQQFQYLKNNRAKGVQQANVIRDNVGEVTGRFGKISNNDKWYREFYADNKRPPTVAELRELAKKHLREGFGTDTMNVPANEEYLQALQELENYKNIKASNGPTQTTTSITVQKGKIPTPQIIPSTLREAGQTLTPNQPIQSALEAKLNKPRIAQGKNIDAPFRLTPAEQTRISPTIEAKPLSNINTLPIENKSLTGQIKAQGEAAVAKDNIVGNAAKSAKEAVSKAPIKKDISGFQAYTTDVYRNFEKVFGDDYAAVKKDILDPFDNAKKSKVLEDQQLMSNLKKNIVDKFNIQKGSKESALVQQYGEKRLSYESLVKQVGKAKADNIVEADKWFRAEYDRLIDEVNVARAAVYPNQPDKLIPHRTDYYRHFNELSDTFAGLKNIFETPSQISPSLAGASEFTKPKSKFLSFAQKRGQGKFTDDAVGGFLDYINAATYAKHIDTQIPKFRGLAADLAEATEQSKNMNNFIGYLTDFANDLSGKTNPADRFVQKIIPGGRTTFKALNWLNSRVKANTILGNLSSSLSQIANIPQGIAYVKNPVHISKGTGNFLASIFGKGDANLYKKSGFLLERYSDNIARQFDVKLLDQPKKAAAWMLGALDEVGTKSIWSSVYRKGLADGVKDPIKYADDVTRKLVAGRGIGEVPLLQKSKLMQLVAPFTLEVNNLWKVQKDFIKAKDFGGLALLYLANFALNKGMEEVRGDGVVFDPIQAIYDALSEEDLTAMERAGRLGGEVLSNVPLGSTAASLYPEYGVNNEFVSLPTREKLFGRNDPTRFGSGLLVAKGLQDPLYKIAPPFAGGQIKKTVQAGQDLGLLPKAKKQEGSIIPKLEKQDLPASYSQTKQGDRLRTTIDPTPGSIAKGLAFGRGAIPELKAYYESGKVPFGTKQTENFKKLVDKGYEPNKLFKTLNGIRGTAKKADIVVKLRESGYNSREITEIWEVFYK